MKKSIGYITGREFMELAAMKESKVLSTPKSLNRKIGKVETCFHTEINLCLCRHCPCHAGESNQGKQLFHIYFNL